MASLLTIVLIAVICGMLIFWFYLIGTTSDSVPASAEAEGADASAPPGWYDDPRGGGQRWWGGERWGRRWQNGDRGQADGRNNSLAIIGWITAILIPIVGLTVGIILSSRNDRRGLPIALTAIGIFVAWIVFWVVLNAIVTSSVS